MKTVSIVVPVYYNAESLPHLFQELVKLDADLAARDFALELIFVDDGSGDDSFAQMMAIKQARPQTRLVRLTRNFGAVHASKAGLGLVTGDCFLVLAADLQDPPSLVLDMIEKWKGGSKFVLCARTNRADPLVARIWSAAYYKLLRLMVVPDYPKGGYDLALMDRAMLPYLVSSSKNVNTPLFAYWLGFRPVIIPYERRQRLHGRSRWTFSKRVKFFVDSLLGFSVVPIRVISVSGLAVSILSVGYGLVIVFNAARGRAPVQGFPTVVALLTFLLGLIILMLGVIGEYLWRIFDELNKRPESVIDEVF